MNKKLTGTDLNTGVHDAQTQDAMSVMSANVVPVSPCTPSP